MRNFQKLYDGMDTAPLLNAIIRQPELWNKFNLRTTFPNSPHAEADDILLRFNDLKAAAQAIYDGTQAMNYPAFDRLPEAKSLVFGLMGRMQGEQLGRVMITRLKPGAKITPHTDMGAPATFYDRYHIVLQSQPGCIFRAGDEQVMMNTGEVWWFNNNVEHEVVNNSADDRITMIVDIRTYHNDYDANRASEANSIAA